MKNAKPEQTAVNDSGTVLDSGEFLTHQVRQSFTEEAMKLDQKGRCPNCLKKPLPYRAEGHFFCHKCCRQYSMLTGEQEVNWAWHLVREGQWEATYPDNGRHDYMHAKPTANALRQSQEAMEDEITKSVADLADVTKP